jgi:hypothetical protein
MYVINPAKRRKVTITVIVIMLSVGVVYSDEVRVCILTLQAQLLFRRLQLL